MIGFGNGGQLALPNWSAQFQSVGPFGTSNEAAEITSIYDPVGSSSKYVASVTPQLRAQPAFLFFDPSLGEPDYLSNGEAVVTAYTYPSSGDVTYARQGRIRVSQYGDGGLIDDEIMVGNVVLEWEGGVLLSDLTLAVVNAVLLTGEEWVTLEGPTVGVRT